MAWAEVGSGSQRATDNDNNGVDSGTLAFPGNVTSGSLLVVGGSNWQSGGPATIAVTDSLSTSYTVLTATTGEFTEFIAYGIAPSGGANTVTVNPSGTGNYVSYSIDEFSGTHATPLNVDGGSSTGTSTSASDGITTTVADCLLIGVVGHTSLSAPTLTAGGSYTLIGEVEDNNTNQAHSMVFRIVTTAQAYTVDWTIGSSVTWVAMTAAFKPSVATPKGLILLMGDGGFM